MILLERLLTVLLGLALVVGCVIGRVALRTVVRP